MDEKKSETSTVRSNDWLCCNHRVITQPFYQAFEKATEGLPDKVKWDLFWMSLRVVNATFCPFCDEIIIAT